MNYPKVPSTYVFYDTETASRNGQIRQYASVRTDDSFNILETKELFCKPYKDVLPEVKATMVHHISMKECFDKGLTEPEFADKIDDDFTLNENTCIIGYNSISFDDERKRELSFRSMRDPYQPYYYRGNSRADLFHITKAFYAMSPEGINFPVMEDGTVSLKLEHLAKANGIVQENAHNAVDDVIATANFAKFLFEKNPQFFNFCMNSREKNFCEKYMFGDDGKPKPFLYIGGYTPRDRFHTAPMIMLFNDPKNKNAYTCLDLQMITLEKIREVAEMDAKDIPNLIFSKNPDEKLHVQSVAINKHPILLPMGAIKKYPDKADRLSIDPQEINMKAMSIINDSSFIKFVSKIKESQELTTYPEKPLYQSIYEKFFSYADKEFMKRMSTNNYDQWVEISKQLKDNRAYPLTIRAIGNIDASLLKDKERKIFEEWITESYNDKEEKYGCSLPRFWYECKEVLDSKETTMEEKVLVQELLDEFNPMAGRFAPELWKNKENEIEEYKQKFININDDNLEEENNKKIDKEKKSSKKNDSNLSP